MPLDTDTQVDTLKRVRDKANDLAAPANQTIQEAIRDRLTTIRDSVATEATLSDVLTRLTTVRDRLTTIRDIQQNGSLKTATYSTASTSAEQLPTYSVADGGSVLVTAQRGNTGAVYVGNANAQPVTLESPKDGFAAEVDNVDEIYVRTPNSGDGVGVTWEA